MRRTRWAVGMAALALAGATSVAAYDEIARTIEKSEAACRQTVLVRHRIEWLNGEPAIVSYVGPRVAFTTSVDTDGERIFACYRMLDPEKRRRLSIKGSESLKG